MEYLPLFFQLRGKPVLLVGGGTVALRKARLISRAGAVIHCVCPEINPELQDLLQRSGGRWTEGIYAPSQLEGVQLVVAATPDEAVNQQVAGDCQGRQLPVNVVDSPELCSVIFPSIVDRSPLVVAISSSGQSPVLARYVRSRIEAMLPAAYGRLAAFAGSFRKAMSVVTGSEDERRRLWERVIHGPIAELVLAGRESEARERLEDMLKRHDGDQRVGEVFLIGAGPGDPDLMTFRAERLLQRADVVLYDRLVSPDILDMARRDAERIFVGKKRSQHAVTQSEINGLLASLAKSGKTVARLKGGDPFIFGRGGEEIEELAAQGIPFQVVPGITAASGCASYAGIPLTHRDYAQSVRFITGHLKDGDLKLPWNQFCNVSETLVFYMGLASVDIICSELVANGRSPETPVALVEQGTTRHQRTLRGTLATLPDLVQRSEVNSPTLLIIGDVVALRDKLAWFGEAENPGSWPPAAGVEGQMEKRGT
ncbi:MAG: siroheme synthase CysG [Halieaceae bacterium]|jgi:uroporphyrin-III C-methyltransferase/precorrin-2 dehydrogenase/sirohydrochlorin ferrochelatase|nr:siroheme synthase CysG [Halieaceae bacterium]